MQVVQNRLLGNLTGVLHLKLLLELEPSLALGDLENGTLHQRVHHAEFDGLVAGRRRAGVEEEHGTRLGTVVCVGKAVKGEPRLGRRVGLCQFCNAARRGCLGNELHHLSRGVNFLRISGQFPKRSFLDNKY
jgi:hypothetical protein